ncbi:MAG: pitrilysin family protein [Gemmobacter sp.]|nr:pitrilysin family protein [Gemmobacter sp.]
MIARAAALVLTMALPVLAETPVQELKTPGGNTVWMVQSPDIPFVALELRFRGGTALDAPAKAGAVNLMTALLEEGSGDLDAQGFAAARDALAAEFRFGASLDSVSVSARFLTENRDQALVLLRQAIVSPNFDATSLERVRGQVLSGLRADERDPGAIADRKFDQIAFGDHAYGQPSDGTIATVTALTRDDIAAAHLGALARDRVHVAAVGDISPADLATLVDTLLADLPATGTPLPGPAKVALTGGVTVEPFPGPQSVLVFGHEGIPRTDPDFFAAFIAAEAFGGGRFSARLMSEVREKRGLTYGISAGLLPLDQADLVVGQMSTANGTVAQSMQVIREEWTKLATDGLTEAELAATKTYLTGSYPLRFDGNGPIARILVGLQMQGYPVDYPAKRNALIDAVTLDDVRRVAARVFRPDDLHFVVVGTPEGVQGQ